MSKLMAFYDNLIAHLSSGVIEELTERRVLLVTGDDPDLPRTIEKHVQLHVMKTKGIGVVVYSDEATNPQPDVADETALTVDISFDLRLFIHPHKFGKRYDPAKREAVEVLESLVKHVNGATIEPTTTHCDERVVVADFAPIADGEFWVWTIGARRRIHL